MAVETIRVTESDKDLLVRLKRTTGIRNWNVLCRWAFCLSLADDGPTSVDPRGVDSNVEMTWRVFGGPHADIYWTLLRTRLVRDGETSLDAPSLERHFYRHLHRGIGLLSNLSAKPSLHEMLALTTQ